MGRAAFQQKVVVITGGCAGIGRALALRLPGLVPPWPWRPPLPLALPCSSLAPCRAL